MFKIITVPYDEKTGGFDEEVLNKFSLGNRLISHKTEFFLNEGKPYWTVFLEYDPQLSNISDKGTEMFNEPEKALLERIRIWRKEKADKAGVPVYIVATNRELHDIVLAAPKTLEALKGIKGFGRKKVEKYGDELIKLLSRYYEKQ